MSRRRRTLDALPVPYRWILRVGAVLVPPRYRERWVREWVGEVSGALHEGRRGLRLVLRTVWCAVDALWWWIRERRMTMMGWSSDLRIAVRSFLKRPAASVVMVLTLALGIGANTALFSVVEGVLLRELPVEEPERLVRLSQALPSDGIGDWPYSFAQYREIVRAVDGARFAIHGTTAMNLVVDGRPERIGVARVSRSYFEVLGVDPVRGRTFTREEEVADAPVVVASHDFWTSALGARPDVVGSSLQLGGRSHRIVGVLPPEADVLEVLNRVEGWGASDEVDLYIPMEPFGRLQGETTATVSLLARIDEGATVEAVRGGVEQVVTPFMEARGRPGWVTRVQELHSYLVGSVRAPLLLLWGAVGLLLAMVFLNLSGILLVRGLGRQGEFAARRALGASGARIARQLLTEGAVLALAGGACGVALGAVAVEAVGGGSALPRGGSVSLNATAVLFALGLSAVAAAALAVLPALFASRASPAAALRSARGSMAGAARRSLRVLVAVEVMLALVLLVGSGVMLRSFQNLLAQDPGYDASGLLLARTSLEADRYPTDPQVRTFTDQVLDELRSRPEVTGAAAMSLSLPHQGPRNAFGLQGVAGPDGESHAVMAAVSPGYFEMLDIPVLDGRAFDDGDGPGSPPVVVVTQRLAETVWPGESAVGKRIEVGSWRSFRSTGEEVDVELREVVGVVGDLTGVGMAAGEPVRKIFTPYAQDPWPSHGYLVETEGRPASLASRVREAVAEVDPGQPVYQAEPYLEEVRATVARERVVTLLLVGFAGAALLLSVLGIYGVVAHSVALRRREVGIRMALGSEASRVVVRFLWEGMIPVLAGLGMGAGLAFTTVGVLRGLLYQVEPADPVAFLGALALLVVAAVMAALLPASRATRTEPARVLREE